MNRIKKLGVEFEQYRTEDRCEKNFVGGVK